jgi:hypothetical protein
MELLLEYDPAPPYRVGSPHRADTATLGRADELVAPRVALVKDSVERLLRQRNTNERYINLPT